MRIQNERMDCLYKLDSPILEYLLIAIKEAQTKKFDITGCNVSIYFKERFDTHMNEYIIHFHPKKITSENAMEYELVQDDLSVFIDAITKKVIRSCPSI